MTGMSGNQDPPTMTLPTVADAAVSLRNFVPRRMLRNAHLQTLAGNFIRRQYTLPEPEPLLVEVEGPVASYGPTQVLCHCHWQPREVRRERLTVILIHGLEGSSNSQYVVGNTARALDAGLNVVRMNMRSCGGTDHLSPTIYHSGQSGDVARVMERVLEEQEVSSIALVGYSMGGNLALKLLGEFGVAPPPQLKAVVGISPLMDLTPSSAALHEPQNRIYEWHFLRNMRRRLRYKSQLYPELYPANLAGQLRSMRDFDEHVVARYGGFRGADDYYETVASSQYGSEFRVPTLILHSLDDPFIRMLPSTRAALIRNPQVTFVETEHGGHCAFLGPAAKGSAGDASDGYWAEHLLLNFLLERVRGG